MLQSFFWNFTSLPRAKVYRARLKRTFALHISHHINILCGGRDSVEPQTFVVPIELTP